MAVDMVYFVIVVYPSLEMYGEYLSMNIVSHSCPRKMITPVDMMDFF